MSEAAGTQDERGKADGEGEPTTDASLVTPGDLGSYAFVHDVRVASDGLHAFYELTRVDMEANRYRTDIWSVDAATNESRALTSSGEEGHYEVCDDGSVLFVSKRRSAVRTKSAGSSDPDLSRATELFRIDPTGGEARLVATIPDLAVSDWHQVDATRFVLRCREKADASSPVVEIEEVPFFENGGTYMAGTRWGLRLLDLSRLDESLVAGEDALRLLTLPDEEVDDWALSQDRSCVVFASRRYTGLRPVTDKLWSLGVTGVSGARTLVDDAPYRRSMLAPFNGGVLYLATDMCAHGVNEDPHPWWAPLDGSALPTRIEESEPDLYYGCAVGGDSAYGGGLEAKAAGDAWYFLSTEFDNVYLRRMDASGAMTRLVDEPGAVKCFDTANGHTFWYVAARGCDLPELYRLDADGDAAAPAHERRITHASDALAGKQLSAPEAFTFESGGDTLTGYVLAPAGYEPGDGKTYPGVLEIHGGPKAAYGTVLSQEMQCLAARGYFVFYTNPHGSAGHGVAFSDIRGRYGQQDYADLMALTDEVLRRYPAIDAGRLAVMGGSYGGFMTNWVIGHTDRFRCANSQRSIANYMTKCLDSDIGYWVNMPETTGWLPGADDVSADPDETSVLPIVGEEKVGSALAFEGDNPWRIWAQSPLAFAGNVHTPTLFLHSDEDYRCPLNEGMQMFTALQLRGVPSRLVIFKGECHGLCRSGKPQNRVRRLEEILSWYERWLGGEPAEEGTPAGAEA